MWLSDTFSCAAVAHLGVVLQLPLNSPAAWQPCDKLCRKQKGLQQTPGMLHCGQMRCAATHRTRSLVRSGFDRRSA